MNNMNVQLIAGENLLRSAFLISHRQFVRRFLKKIKNFDIIYISKEMKNPYK